MSKGDNWSVKGSRDTRREAEDEAWEIVGVKPLQAFKLEKGLWIYFPHDEKPVKGFVPLLLLCKEQTMGRQE